MKKKNFEQEKAIQYGPMLTTVPYQLCPKCSGQGIVSKPPYIAGDVYEWSSMESQFICNVCEGKKIIPQFIIPLEYEEKG